MTLESLQDLYIEQLRTLYDAELQLIDALPELAEHAAHNELRKTFEDHLAETRRHKMRLEQVFQNLDVDANREPCKAMRGLIQESKDLMRKGRDPDVVDASLITAAQRVEHYEIAAYGSVATYAELLGRDGDHDLLGQTLSEEKAADAKLKQLAKEGINLEATGA